jgi:hypothetical protein
MMPAETELYAPVKAFLERQGFRVAGEVNTCDVVGMRGDEIVVVELKRVFNLELVFQSIARKTLTETVYAAVEAKSIKKRSQWRKITKLCRLLGLGLLTVRQNKCSAVDVVLEPAPYTPRLNSKKRKKLVREFQSRSADYNTGGCTRVKIVTAYREQALRLAWHLREGPRRVKDVAFAAPEGKAAQILRSNYYNWFDHVDRGTYRLTPDGVAALERYAAVVRGFAPLPLSPESPVCVLAAITGAVSQTIKAPRKLVARPALFAPAVKPVRPRRKSPAARRSAPRLRVPETAAPQAPESPVSAPQT